MEINTESKQQILSISSTNLGSSCLSSEEAYLVYRQCSFQLSYENYLELLRKRALNHGSRSIAYADGQQILGILFVQVEKNTATIEGIAVAKQYQKRGVGKKLLEYVKQGNPELEMLAETDDEAVGFYREMGFQIEKICKDYPDGVAVRYHCRRV